MRSRHPHRPVVAPPAAALPGLAPTFPCRSVSLRAGRVRRRQLAATVAVGLSSLVLGALHAPAQTSGRFPDTGNNAAIVIQYSMTGVAVADKPRDNGPSMQWHRRIQGRVTGRRIGLSATVSLSQPGYPRCNAAGGGFYFTVEARVSAGRERATFVHPKSGQCRDATFPVTVNLAVDVPEDATEAGISVRATYVNPMYGDRVSLVYGEFAATPSTRVGAGASARPSPRMPRAASGGDGGGPGDTGGDDVPPWKIAVGAAAAAAAIAAVAKTLASRRAKKPSRPPQYGYVLQLSAKVVEVEWGVPASLTVTAWRVDERGGHTLASDVPIEISTPDSALVIQPRSGTGTLTCQLSLDGQPRARTLDLEIKARGGAQTITATVTARIGLAVEVVVQWDPPAGRTYCGVSLAQPNEFAADGRDVLKAVVYVRVKGKVPEEITRSKIRPSIDPGDGDFELRIDPTCDEPDKVRVLIKSKRALLNTADPPPKVALQVEAKTVTRGGYDVDLPPVVVPLDPRRVFLKLWVVPGGARHTSEARCYACLAPDSSAALRSFPLMLKVEALGSGHLTIDGPDQVETGTNGVAGWLLRYSGLTWENYLNARFTVRCGPAVGRTAPIQGTDAIIDVGANVTQLLEAIHDQQNSTLNLNNNCFTPSMLDIVIPNEMSGAYTNIRHEFGNTDWDEYICGNYSARIFEWMAMRRFGNSTSCDAAPFSVMNGIEIDQYAMWWVGPVSHHFAGFHLSGTGPLDDPRFIDPWWRQEWRDQSRRQLAGLQTRNTERFLLVASIGYVVALVSAVGALLGASAPFIAGVAKNLGGRLPAVDLAMGDVYEDAPANFNSSSLYARYWATWLKRTLDHLRTTHPTVPAVEHIHAW